MSDDAPNLRILEALLFAASEPVDAAELAERLPAGTDVGALLARLRADYSGRGVNLVRFGDKWALRTAEDLAPFLCRDVEVPRKLSRAAVETLAIIAYHQPVTRAEIEQMRGVSVSRGTLDILLEAGWVRPKGRRRTPGRPATWITTDAFLDQFGLESTDDLPGLDELRATGLLEPAGGAPAPRLPLGDDEPPGSASAEDRVVSGGGAPQPGDDDTAKEAAQQPGSAEPKLSPLPNAPSPQRNR